MCSTCFPRTGLPAGASLSSTGSSEASSPASTVLSKRYDFLPPIPPYFVTFVWRYLGATRWVRSSADECTAEAWSWSPGSSRREVAEETGGSPKFLGIPNVRLHMFSRRRQDRSHQTITVQQRGPSYVKSKGSHERTFGAQWHGLRTRCLRFAVRVTPTHARLASGRWSGATGRAFTRRVPTKGFRMLPYISSPFPKLCLAQSHRPE